MDGRELLLNVLLCPEMARGYTRNHISCRCIMKIDMKKAYGLIYWEAVKEILDHLQFRPTFISWVMACITTPAFTI